MPALMKASPYITATIEAASMHPTLHGQCSYTTEATYSRYFYSQYNRPMVNILAVAQVGHCLSAAFGSHHRREGQTPSADWIHFTSNLVN